MSSRELPLGGEQTPQSADVKSILALAGELKSSVGDRFHDQVTEGLYTSAAKIAGDSVSSEGSEASYRFDRKLDELLTSRRWGFPIMLLLLSIVLWITIEGAEFFSDALMDLLVGTIHPMLKNLAAALHLPWWLDGFLVDGIYLGTAWVVAVMLPPMAIFFPLFTILEDFGYLPRVAFNLDNLFRKAGAHGKQALTMSMGFGCNAAGVVATRIIDSPRERLIAIITNNFSICNGRWGILILMSAIFVGATVPKEWSGVVATGAVVGIVLLGIIFTLLVSWGLSRTVLKGEASFFTLELPPYRPPQIMQTIYTSIIDRTLIILWRAIIFAAPAGGVIWLISNIYIGDQSIALWAIQGLDPFGIMIGLNGVILLAYIVAIPANEIIIPTILMLTALALGDSSLGEGAGVMFEGSDHQTREMLLNSGWTLLTGINIMLFALLHNPCSTTIYTIYKETGSGKWTVLATFLPVVMGIVVCFIVAQLWYLFM